MTPPLLRGGQGRSAADVRSDGTFLIMLLAAFLVFGASYLIAGCV